MAFDLKPMRDFYRSGATRHSSFRKERLSSLLKGIKEYEAEILSALHADLGKPSLEAYLSEVSFIYGEIKFTLKNLDSWMAPQRVPTGHMHGPGRSHIRHEPLGVVLVVGPWNYPFQLVIAPLIGALAAGNCAVLKPSEMVPKTSEVLKKLIEKTFDPRHVCLVEGDAKTSQELLKLPWDHIFFTGGLSVAKIVMAEAAKNLTPVTLELGGKSPCVVDSSTQLDATARRIVWGKFFNAGQTCVAPDYVLVPSNLKVPLLERMSYWVKHFFGEDPQKSPDFGRIVNQRHFDRLMDLVDPSKLVVGGQSNRENRYIAPTLFKDVDGDDKIMRDEIFGPLLPVLEYQSLDQAISFINDRPKPLAFYFFSKNRNNVERVSSEVSFGGGCINDTLVHLANPRLPFGGVGSSGIGQYHGKYSFETFSHKKSIVKRTFWIDPMMRYPPYKNRFKLIKKVM